MKNLSYKIVSMVIFISFLVTCSGTENVSRDRVVHDTQSRYMSSAGSDFMRDEIKKGLESVNRIQNTAAYRTYQFDLNNLPTRGELEGTEFRRLAADTKLDHHSRAGSAVVLSNRRGKSVLITASHVVSFPDTVWHYLESTRGGVESLVEAVSVKQTISRFILGNQGIYDFEVSINDERRDLALLIQPWEQNSRPQLPPLELGIGRYEALDWTDQVYAVGYPLGIGMVTRAMVSKSVQSPRRSFVLDASINRGFSGGAIFAERSDGSGMEWVGMIASASAVYEEYLTPDGNLDEEFHPELEYRGAVFVQRTQRINYGITYAVGIDQIREFLNDHRDELRDQGITLSNFE